MIKCKLHSLCWRRSISPLLLLTLLLVMVKTEYAGAIDPVRAISQYGHRTWTARTGLPGQAVYEMLQAQDGYLYLRTGSRLIRFDGVRFTPVDVTLDDRPIQ